VSKAQAIYWLSLAALAAPLALAIKPCGFFDGPRGD
jgi:hypothetical protein